MVRPPYRQDPKGPAGRAPARISGISAARISGSHKRLANIQNDLEGVDGKLAGLRAATAILARDQDTIDSLATSIQRGLPKLIMASREDRAAVLAGFIERIDVSKDRALVQLCVPGAGIDLLHDRTEKLPRMDSNHE